MAQILPLGWRDKDQPAGPGCLIGAKRRRSSAVLPSSAQESRFLPLDGV